MWAGYVVVQLLSQVQLFATLRNAAHQASLFFTISWSLLKLMSIKLVTPSNNLILSRPLSSCLQSSPAGSFPMSQFFASGSQSNGISALALVLPMNIQDWFPLGLTGLISLQSKELSRVFLQHHSSKASILHLSAFFMIQLSHPYMITGKNHSLD